MKKTLLAALVVSLSSICFVGCDEIVVPGEQKLERGWRRVEPDATFRDQQNRPITVYAGETGGGSRVLEAGGDKVEQKRKLYRKILGSEGDTIMYKSDDGKIASEKLENIDWTLPEKNK